MKRASNIRTLRRRVERLEQKAEKMRGVDADGPMHEAARSLLNGCLDRTRLAWPEEDERKIAMEALTQSMLAVAMVMATEHLQEVDGAAFGQILLAAFGGSIAWSLAWAPAGDVDTILLWFVGRCKEAYEHTLADPSDAALH